jgi:hypothetical protein
VNDGVANSDRLERLEQLVPLCDSIRKGGEYRGALAQAANEVKKAAIVPARLESLEHALRLLHTTHHLSATDVGVELDKLFTAGRSLEQSVDTDALKDTRFSVKEISEAVQRLEAHVGKAWRDYVRAEFSSLQRLGGVLAGIPDTKATGLELQTWTTRVMAAADGSAPSANSVKHVEDATAERAKRVEALRKMGIDAAVNSFLLEVANKQATLGSVTPQVLEWLRARNAHSRFRIEPLT